MGTQDGSMQNVVKVQPARRPSSALDGRRILLGVLLLMIFVAAVTGVVVALAQGMTTVAIIIGLISGAFFARVGC